VYFYEDKEAVLGKFKEAKNQEKGKRKIRPILFKIIEFN